MIIREFYQQRKDGVNLYRTYSDADVMIRQEQTGAEYSEAIDVENAIYAYIETDNPIEPIDTDEATSEDYEAALARLGVNV